MVAHLSNSPDFVHVPFEKIMAEQELRDVRRRFARHVCVLSAALLLSPARYLAHLGGLCFCSI